MVRGVFLALILTILMPLLGHPADGDSRSTVRQLQLENGLAVVWEEDHRQPLVAIEARIRGGVRGEGAYAGTGITHAIEHMLFKGTPTRPAGTLEQEVRRYGGTINAFTAFDVTGVSLFVESRYLNEGLQLLADILQHASFNPEEFEKERAVIISEIQMNMDDPDRRIQQVFWDRHLLEHPYRHPILGHRPLLEHLTVADLASFYAAQYQPQNTTISCAGDVDRDRFPQLVREVFGSWPRGVNDPKYQVVPVEPPAASAKTVTVELPVQTAYVTLGFPSVRLADPDLYSLDVLANLLGEGRSSRLYETLIRQRQLTHAISAWNYTPYDPGVFAIQFRTDPEKVQAAIDAIFGVLDDLIRNGVTEAELLKAKRSISADYLFGLQTVEGKAADLANAITLTGDPLFSRSYVAAIQRVTRQQVQAAARRFCERAKVTTAVIQPQTAAPVAASQERPTPVRTQVEKVALHNGMTSLIGVDRTLPIAAIVVAFHGGVRAETEETQGLSNLAAQMLTKGTTRKTALEIAEAAESLGATLEPFSGRDGFGLVVQLLPQDLTEGIALMNELVTDSTFPEAELAIQRTLIRKQLDAQDDEIFDVGWRLLRRALFASHPYRFNPLGHRDTIGSLSRPDCVNFAKQWVVPSNAVMAVFGDVDAAAVERQLQRSFGRIASASSPWPHHLPVEALEGIRRSTLALDKEQALVLLGFRGSTYTAEDRYALDLMTAILSGMAGRLFQSVREQQGLSYTLGASHVPGWDPGYLLVYAATRPEEQTSVLAAIEEQLQLTVTQGFTEEELDQAKRYLIGLHRMELQHLVGLAKAAVLDELYGLGFDAWTQYDDRIRSVTVSMVNEAAKRYLTLPQHAEVVISPNGHADLSEGLLTTR